MTNERTTSATPPSSTPPSSTPPPPPTTRAGEPSSSTPPPSAVGEGTERTTPSHPFDTLVIRPWDDPLVEQLGFDPRSSYVERYWTSILGPSATLLLRRLATGLEIAPDGFELDTVAWAQELGIGIRGGKNGPFWRSLDRLARFGATQRNGALVVVRRKLPPLNLRQIERLPPHLQQAHHAWTARQNVRRDPGTPSEAA